MNNSYCCVSPSKFAGHVIRGSSEQLMKNIVVGTIEGPRKLDRSRRVWTNDLEFWLDKTFHQILVLAADRAAYMANVHYRYARITMLSESC